MYKKQIIKKINKNGLKRTFIMISKIIQSFYKIKKVIKVKILTIFGIIMIILILNKFRSK